MSYFDEYDRMYTQAHPEEMPMSELTTSNFWKRTAERAVKTFAQAALGLLTVELVMDSSGWLPAAIAVGIATATSVLSSIASAQVGDPEDPSLV